MTDPRSSADAEGAGARRWAIGIVIPACNEEISIGRCIRSIISAYHALTCRSHIWIVVVADNCHDSTMEVARDALGPHGVAIPAFAGSAGTARRLGVEAVLSHFKDVPLFRIWIANTDADSFAPTDWLVSQLSLAEAGHTAIAGIVELDTEQDQSPTIHALFQASYELRPDGTHDHVHGANFGVRGDAYLNAGGWADKPLAEDHCLWNRLKKGGWPTVSTTTISVITSPRLKGRAPGGFADTLNAHVLRAEALAGTNE